MNKRKTIQDELNELNSFVNPNSDTNPYSVPEGYFEGLAANVLAKIKGEVPVSASQEIVELSPLLAGISRSMLYEVPNDYFHSNIEGLQAFTSASEESLVLSFIEKEMPYKVPTGYFSNFPEQVLEKVTEQRQARIVPFTKRKWVRLAVAAMVTGVIAVSGISYFSGRSGSGSNKPVPVNVALQKASTKELNDFINSTAVTIPDQNTPVTAKNNTRKEKKLFDDVSDKELDAFLNQIPTDAELDIN